MLLSCGKTSKQMFFSFATVDKHMNTELSHVEVFSQYAIQISIFHSLNNYFPGPFHHPSSPDPNH